MEPRTKINIPGFPGYEPEDSFLPEEELEYLKELSLEHDDDFGFEDHFLDQLGPASAMPSASFATALSDNSHPQDGEPRPLAASSEPQRRRTASPSSQGPSQGHFST